MGLQGRICDVEGICVAVLVYAVDICICYLKHFS